MRHLVLSITLFAPDQHDLYDGRFVMSANRVHLFLHLPA